MVINTQPNEARCQSTKETHVLPIPVCCPFSKNPTEGSEIHITYTPKDKLLEVQSLHDYVNAYRGGLHDDSGNMLVRSMEGMIQQITADCSETLGVYVETRALLNINPNQKIIVECSHPHRPHHLSVPFALTPSA